MMLFGRKKEKRNMAKNSFDPEKQKPVLRKSICTGETTAGFKDLSSGVYHDVALIRSDADLRKFMDEYGITSVPETEY